MSAVWLLGMPARIACVAMAATFMAAPRAFDAELSAADRPTLLAHGDRINDEDRLYHLWHRISRNELSSTLIRTMPKNIAQQISTKLEEKFRSTNQAYKTGMLPMKHLERLSLRAKNDGVDQVVLGHFHADKTIEAKGGVPVIIAPAWLDQRKILIADTDGKLLSVNPLESA